MELCTHSGRASVVLRKSCIIESFFKVCITTFATFVLSSEKNILTAEKAFVSLALFNLLRFPLVVFPSIINSIIEVNAQHSRFGALLNGFIFRQLCRTNASKDFSTVKKSTTMPCNELHWISVITTRFASSRGSLSISRKPGHYHRSCVVSMVQWNGWSVDFEKVSWSTPSS